MLDFTGGLDGKEFTCNAGNLGWIPGSGISPGEGNGYQLHYSHLENSMDRGAWQAIGHGVQTGLRMKHTHSSYRWGIWGPERQEGCPTGQWDGQGSDPISGPGFLPLALQGSVLSGKLPFGRWDSTLFVVATSWSTRLSLHPFPEALLLPQPPCLSFWSWDILGRNEPSFWHWELCPSSGCIWNNWGLENMAEDWCSTQLRHLFFHQIFIEHQLGNKHHETGWDNWLVFRLMRNKQLECSLGSARRWKTGAIWAHGEAIAPSVGRGWAESWVLRPRLSGDKLSRQKKSPQMGEVRREIEKEMWSGQGIFRVCPRLSVWSSGCWCGAVRWKRSVEQIVKTLWDIYGTWVLNDR